MTSAFVIREKDVPTPLRVELKDDDAPYGRAQEEAAFEMGGEVIRKRVKIPGRRAPLFHMFTPDDTPLVIRGAFRDIYGGRGHAKQMVDKIESIRARMNLLVITWDGDQWDGILQKTAFGVEAPGHRTYELTFEIGLPPETNPSRVVAPVRGDADALARVLAQLRARRIGPVFARSFLATLDAGMTAIEDGLAAMGDAVRALDDVRSNIVQQVRRVSTLGNQVQQLAQQTGAVIDRTRADQAGIVQNVRDATNWSNYSLGMHDTLADVRSTARSASEEALLRQRTTERLYRIRPGDTLESIARELLGDAGRVGELGLTPAQVVVGTIVRVPAAGVPG